jgi:hypothetical protein
MQLLDFLVYLRKTESESSEPGIIRTNLIKWNEVGCG